MNNYTVAILGPATIDKIVHRNQSEWQLGGVVAYAGITFKRLGINTVVVTNVAEKDISILDSLRNEGIHLFRGDSKNTAEFINYIIGNDRRQEMPQAADPIKLDQLKTLIDMVDHLHLGPLQPNDFDLDLLEFIKLTKLRTSLDVQGYIRSTRKNRVIKYASKNLSSALSCSQIIKGDEEEISLILNFYKTSITELMHRFNIMEIIITDGFRGGRIKTNGGGEICYNAKPINSFVDSTGAGDVFFAAYIMFHFYEGRNIVEASEMAAKLAAEQIEGKHILKKILRLKHS